MLNLNIHGKGRQETVRIIHVDIELIFSQVLNIGVFFLTLLVDKGELLLGCVVQSELITHFPRVDVMFTCSSEFQSFQVGLGSRNVTLTSKGSVANRFEQLIVFILDEVGRVDILLESLVTENSLNELSVGWNSDNGHIV